MSNEPPPPPGFALVDEPPPPPGFVLVDQTPRRRRSRSTPPPPPPGFTLVDDGEGASAASGEDATPTGEAHDGDTFRLRDGRNARLYGADAFELNQTGRARDGTTIPLGQRAREYMARNVSPASVVGLTGAETYGRPVASLTTDGEDVARGEIDAGYALATPEYLKADPQRLREYMEAERLARLNRRGANAGTFQSPADFRHGKPDPWAKPEYSDTAKPGDDAVFFDEATPFQGLRPDIAAGYVAVTDDPKSTSADALAYAKANGFALDPNDVDRFYAARAKGAKPSGGVTYKDAPRVLTDPGDGRFGATMRGVADPLNMLDEAGAVVDTLGGTDGRESLFNSDRRFGDILANNLDQNRSILANDEAAHPYYRMGGQFAGGLVMPGAAVDGVGLLAARQVLREGGTRMAAVTAARAAVRNRLITGGAAEGAVSGFGAGENWTDRGTGAVVGAGVGGALGAAAGVGGQAVVDAISSRTASRLARSMPGNDRTVLPDDVALSRINGENTGATEPPPPPGFTLVTPSTEQSVARQRDTLTMPPPVRALAVDVSDTPVNTAAPVRPAPAPRAIEDVQSEIDAWAARNGVQSQTGADLPGVMLHGSPRPDIQEFDPYGRGGYGLFGAGTYLTDSAQIAASYSKKGLTKAAQETAADRTMYAVRQAVKKPIDMDAPADRALWEDAARKLLSDHDGAFFEASPNATNEQLWREAEDFLSGEMVTASEGRETMDSLLRTMGYDGITHIGGGRVGKGGPRHRVVIALDPEQTEIVDRLSVGSLMNPPGPRNPDWIDIGQREAGQNSPIVERLNAYLGRGDIPRRVPNGDRTPDRIDVNARPTPLLNDVTEAQRAAQSQRIEPRDVLPIPSNTVASADEAAQIGAGMYSRVKAPKEAKALSSRSIPSPNDGTKTIAKRGPLDLVTWLRSQGGIRAQGGELEHYGIDNTPRAGMDFAAGEKRFGPLVSNSGMNYDEAAMRAHEAGFFPDHVERPTVDEFLDTLNATHTGRNRAFRTNDLAEVDAYEAQRNLRHSVEGARERGAPLVEDRGQPADLADMDRNAAPVTAYEEWGENAPRIAGNLRLDKLDSPQSIKRALVSTHARVGGFDAATRRRITHAETEQLASELGMTADDLLQRRKGQAFNAEEALAARQILAKSGNELVNMARRVSSQENPGDEALASFREAWTRHVAIQEQVAGATAEAGRALSAFRMTADARAVRGQVLASMAQGPHGGDRMRAVADMILDNASDPASMNKIAAQAIKPKFRDKLVELYYNSILSGPQTHVVNMVGNTLTALGQLPEHAVAAALGAPRARLASGADRVLFSEVGARAVGMIQGAREGLREASRTMVTGHSSDLVTKVEAQETNAISGLKGSIIRTPTRALSAEDEFFKAIARRMELSGLAVRRAQSEGLRGAEARSRVAQLVASPPDDLLAKSFDYGRYLTFQRQLGPIGQSISRMTQAAPLLKLIVPFVRTPTNILKFALERSPAAPILKEWRSDIVAGGARRDLAAAKMMIGSGVMALALEMTARGAITGGGPADENAKGLMRADGWQPYSLKVGDKYYSYQRLDPYSTTLGVAADFADLQSHMSDKQKDEVAGLLVASTLKNLGNKTWFSGLSDLSDAINDPGRYGPSYIRNRLSSVVVPAIVAQGARANDPVLRDAKSILDSIRSRVPGLSSSLLPRRDVLGQEIRNEGGLGPDIVSPIWTSKARRDPVVRALLDSRAQLSKPTSKVRGRELSPAEYDRYQVEAGSTTRSYLSDLIDGPGYRSVDVDERKDALEAAATKARRVAREKLFGKPPSRARAAGRREAPPPPPRFTLVQ